MSDIAGSDVVDLLALLSKGWSRLPCRKTGRTRESFCLRPCDEMDVALTKETWRFPSACSVPDGFSTFPASSPFVTEPSFKSSADFAFTGILLIKFDFWEECVGAGSGAVESGLGFGRRDLCSRPETAGRPRCEVGLGVGGLRLLGGLLDVSTVMLEVAGTFVEERLRGRGIMSTGGVISLNQAFGISSQRLKYR